MIIDVFTLFPEIFQAYLNLSILQRAIQKKILLVNVHNIRDWAVDKHHVTDDVPFGGGGGMVMKPEPVFAAVEGVLGSPPDCPVILMTPQGRSFNHETAVSLAGQDHFALVCGRYEGFDERIRQAAQGALFIQGCCLFRGCVWPDYGSFLGDTRSALQLDRRHPQVLCCALFAREIIEGAPDLLFVQSVYGTREITCLTATTVGGDVLWQVGKPSADNGRIYSDLPVQVHVFP